MKALIPALALAASGTAQANIDIVFDFTYDDSQFFSTGERVAVLNAAAAVFETRFADTLSAITSSGPNSFDTVFSNPSAPNGTNIVLQDQSFATNEIRVFVGGANLGSGTLGLGGPGGFGCSGFSSFCSNAALRGQGAVDGNDPVDVAPWGGSISFNDSNFNWHFGLTTAGLDSNEFDFFSVAVHELGHVLGFGTSFSFDALVAGGNFTGANAGTVALAPDQSHWREGTQSFAGGLAQEAAMDPTIFIGQRKNFTDLDFAAMRDIGWEVTPVPEADTWAMLLAGLGLVGFAARRRRV